MAGDIHLYFHDTGSRNPDHVPDRKRAEGMDCFGLGGILINEEDISGLIEAYKAFRAKWSIDYPLHSHEIRGGRGNFGWLKKPENALAFLSELEEFLLALPVVGMAAVVHRRGYVERYKEVYGERTWLMCKTAFSVLVERSAKFARSRERKLRVFYERAGKSEDRDIIAYGRALKREGMPFYADNSAAHGALTAEHFRAIILGEPRGKPKATPMMQIADLLLYPRRRADTIHLSRVKRLHLMDPRVGERRRF
jgi:hypothetical protein